MNAHWQPALPAPSAPDSAASDTPPPSRLREHVDLLLDSRWKIAGITAVALALGAAYAMFGPRVYEANPSLAAANGRLLDWARSGGTLVVQYQQDIARAGMAPFPLTIAQRAERVTEENAAVRLLDVGHPLLAAPNRIVASDFAGWVQERSLYMPSSFDAAYTPVLEMADAAMTPNRAGILVAPLGSGTYVLTTLSFFRQLPAGNPGAARLFVNLLAASAEGKAGIAP